MRSSSTSAPSTCGGETASSSTPDGVIEARGSGGLFGEQRLVDVLAAAPSGSPGELVDRVRAAVTAHQDVPQADDLAILALQLTA